MLCIVKNGPPMKSRTYASLEFWAEDRRNSAAKERPRPLLEDLDRAFWVAPRRSWPVWASRLVMSTRTRSRGGIGIDSEDTG